MFFFVLSNADKTPVDTHRFEASDSGKNLLRGAQKSFPNSSLNSEGYVLNTVIGPYSRFGKYLLVLAFIDLLPGSASWGARRCLNVVEPSVNYAATFVRKEYAGGLFRDRKL
jgi:hypothetical protein